jgi:hypothetical protein
MKNTKPPGGAFLPNHRTGGKRDGNFQETWLRLGHPVYIIHSTFVIIYA